MVNQSSFQEQVDSSAADTNYSSSGQRANDAIQKEGSLADVIEQNEFLSATL